jgi:hypothetical protein
VKYIICKTIRLTGCVSSPCCFLVSTKDSFGAFFTNGFRPCKRQTEWPADSNRNMCWGRTIVLVRGIALLYLHCYILIRPASNHIRTLFLMSVIFFVSCCQSIYYAQSIISDFVITVFWAELCVKDKPDKII